MEKKGKISIRSRFHATFLLIRFFLAAQVERPVVFFDISIGDVAVGRMKMELFSDIVPKTAENFR
jgi:hypothetical protein